MVASSSASPNSRPVASAGPDHMTLPFFGWTKQQRFPSTRRGKATENRGEGLFDAAHMSTYVGAALRRALRRAPDYADLAAPSRAVSGERAREGGIILLLRARLPSPQRGEGADMSHPSQVRVTGPLTSFAKGLRWRRVAAGVPTPRHDPPAAAGRASQPMALLVRTEGAPGQKGPVIVPLTKIGDSAATSPRACWGRCRSSWNCPPCVSALA